MSDETRRIVAILVCDVVGSADHKDPEATSPAGVDEQTRGAVREFVEKHQGEWLQEIGDCALCMFDSAPRALTCAIDIQGGFESAGGFLPRIAIHVGDPLLDRRADGSDELGESANIVTQVLELADPGEICATELVYAAVHGQPHAQDFRFIGEQDLPGVDFPVRAYRIGGDEVPDTSASAGEPVREPEPEAPAVTAPAQAPAKSAGMGWKLPMRVVLGAAVLAFGLAWWLARTPESPNRSSAPTPVPISPTQEPVVEPAVSPERAAEFARLEAFSQARGRLLKLVGSGAFAPRVWTDPDPVDNDTHYSVWVEADCDCTVLLFSVDGSDDEIVLLHPNPFSIDGAASAGTPLQIPAENSFYLRAVGGEGIDVLKLIVLEEPVPFVEERIRNWTGAGDWSRDERAKHIWSATPEQSERVAELAAMVRQLETVVWDEAAAPLQITQPTRPSQPAELALPVEPAEQG
jgi:class 3 adenylate cyclase